MFKWFLFLILAAAPLMAQNAPPVQTPAGQAVSQAVGLNEKSAENPSLVTKLAILAGLSLLPFAIMLLTSFMKIVVVLSMFRQALGVQQTPPNQVLNGIGLLITIYVMFPTGLAMYNAAHDVIESSGPVPVMSAASALFIVNVVDKAKEPLRGFLQRNCSGKHIQSFYQLAYRIFPEPYKTQLKNATE